VITANKGPIAWDYKRLRGIAESKSLEFLHETTVMDGTPVFNLVKETLPGCKVIGFSGILNSTTNYILEEMEAGRSFDEALKEAQIRGFAEAEPKNDIDGWDAAAKTAAIVNVIMGGELNPMTVERIGISHINQGDIEAAKLERKKLKLLCEGYSEAGMIKGRVYPKRFDEKDIFANIDSTSSILSIKTDLMGEICIVERNPEIQQTAYGMYSDILTLIKRLD
jgi:homoserine dehydrogenase